MAPSAGTDRIRNAYRVLAGARSAQPFPLTYVIAAGVGAALGLSAQAAFGWAWYGIAAVVVVATWLVFASSIFWGPDHMRRPNRGAHPIVWAFAPRKALAREEHHHEALVRNVSFPLYGLPASYAGARWLGGWGGTAGSLTSLTLAHGEPMTSCLRVEVSVDPFSDDTGSVDRELDHHGAIARLGVGSDIGAIMRATHDLRMERGARARVKRTIPLDGGEAEFAVATEGDFWIGIHMRDGLRIILRSEGFALESVGLVRIHNVEPYVEGSRKMRLEHRRGG